MLCSSRQLLTLATFHRCNTTAVTATPPPRGLASAPRSRRTRCATTTFGTNCIKIGLPGNLILSKRNSLREVLFSWKRSQRINFRGRPIFIQLPPGASRTSSSPAPRRCYVGSGSSPVDEVWRDSEAEKATDIWGLFSVTLPKGAEYSNLRFQWHIHDGFKLLQNLN